MRRYAADAVSAFATAFRNPQLRRLELAATASNFAGWAYWVTIAVYAFAEGGAAAVGLVGFLRLVAAAVASPFSALLADRHSRRRVLRAADVTRSVALGAAAAVTFAGGPAALVFALAAVVAVATTAFGPAQAALLPSLARTPEELVAANVVTSTIESAALFVGPALAGFLIAASSIGWGFAATAGGFLVSALLVSRIEEPARTAPAPEEPAESIPVALLGGIRAIRRDHRARLLVGLFAAQTFVDGMLGVLLVVTALDLLDLGELGVGLFNSAVGLGGLAGGLVAGVLITRWRLGTSLSVGLVLWGVPIALVAAVPELGAVLVLLAIVGVGNTLIDAIGYTFLQRAVDDRVLGRVFGALETVILLSIAAGALVAPVLIAALGTRGALVVTGAILPVVAILLWRPLHALDARVGSEEGSALLRDVDILRPLDEPILEGLARGLVPRRLAAGEVLFREGDSGDGFWIVADGELEVTDANGRLALVRAGGYVGEIALLRGVPRTATVTARAPTELVGLDPGTFVAAVTGHPESRAAAEAVIAARLGSLRPRATSL